MRVKSPFSQSALFGFIGVTPSSLLAAAAAPQRTPAIALSYGRPMRLNESSYRLKRVTLHGDLIGRCLDDYFEVLRMYIRNDLDRFNRELARDAELRELFFVK